MFFEQDPKE